MRTTIRSIGNSQGVVIPKPLLLQLGLEGEADITIEGDALVLRKPPQLKKPSRVGWAEASKKLAKSHDDVLVMGEFANDDDAELAW